MARSTSQLLLLIVVGIFCLGLPAFSQAAIPQAAVAEAPQETANEKEKADKGHAERQMAITAPKERPTTTRLGSLTASRKRAWLVI